MIMSNRTLSRALTPLLVLAFAAMLPAVTASAATPEEIAERCVNRMVQTTQRTVDAIHKNGAKGIRIIETLDENDKPVPVMIRAAKKTDKKIEKLAIKGGRQINKISEKCLRALNRADADPMLGEVILGARARSLEAIHNASVNTRGQVKEALEAALEDEEAPETADAEAPIEPVRPGRLR